MSCWESYSFIQMYEWCGGEWEGERKREGGRGALCTQVAASHLFLYSFVHVEGSALRIRDMMVNSTATVLAVTCQGGRCHTEDHTNEVSELRS